MRILNNAIFFNRISPRGIEVFDQRCVLWQSNSRANSSGLQETVSSVQVMVKILLKPTYSCFGCLLGWMTSVCLPAWLPCTFFVTGAVPSWGLWAYGRDGGEGVAAANRHLRDSAAASWKIREWFGQNATDSVYALHIFQLRSLNQKCILSLQQQEGSDDDLRSNCKNLGFWAFTHRAPTTSRCRSKSAFKLFAIYRSADFWIQYDLSPCDVWMCAKQAVCNRYNISIVT